MASYDRKDHFYSKAKAEGRRSRAYYKLKELNGKYHFLRPGNRTLDLGAWPGGWLEYTASIVGGRGLVVGIDLVEIDPFEKSNIKLVTGDIRDEESLAKLKQISSDGYDVVMSDMSPKLTGVKAVDRMGAIGLAELALWMCEQMLRQGGHFAVKVFKGNETEEFVKTMRSMFNKVIRDEPVSSRKTSTEFYLVGIGFKRSSFKRGNLADDDSDGGTGEED
jgi:23S rRNA (uridine2552-2'-O)-methyltransferase